MDLIEMLKKQKTPNEGAYTKPMSSLHEFYLTGEIGPAEDYTEWFDVIRHANENDAIKIYINSYGGDLFTAIQFMRVLAETNATKIISVEGACMSAATMIFMCADNFEVTPHSSFMVHNYNSGIFGKGHEMHSQALFERDWSIELINNVYKHFLTDEEIAKVVNGADIWLTGSDVVKRLNLRTEKILEEIESDAEAVEASTASTDEPLEELNLARKPKRKIVTKKS